MYLLLEERQSIESAETSSQALCSLLSCPPFSKYYFLILEKRGSSDVYGGFSEKNSFFNPRASTPKAALSKALPCLLFPVVARLCLKKCQDYLFPHCPTALASLPKGTEINCMLMVIRATPTPMLISTRKSILCLEEHAMESPFLLVLLSALPLSALGCTCGLVPWAENNMENQIKQPLLPALSLLTQFLSHVLNQAWKPLGVFGSGKTGDASMAKDSCSSQSLMLVKLPSMASIDWCRTPVMVLHFLCIWQHLSVGPILLVGSLVCSLPRMTESKPSCSTGSTV